MKSKLCLFVVFLMAICVLVVSVSSSSQTKLASQEDIIENTLNFIKTNIAFGYEGHNVNEIQYELINVEPYMGKIILFYEISDVDNPKYKRIIGLWVDEEQNTIDGVLFQKNKK